MVFHSYVSLPEGTYSSSYVIHQPLCLSMFDIHQLTWILISATSCGHHPFPLQEADCDNVSAKTENNRIPLLQRPCLFSLDRPCSLRDLFLPRTFSDALPATLFALLWRSSCSSFCASLIRKWGITVRALKFTQMCNYIYTCFKKAGCSKFQ